MSHITTVTFICCLTAIINQLWGKCLWINTHFGFYTQSTVCPAPPPPKLQCWARVRTPVVFPEFQNCFGQKRGTRVHQFKRMAEHSAFTNFPCKEHTP